MINRFDRIYLKLITRDNNLHPKHDNIIAAFYYNYEAKKSYYVNFSHSDFPIENNLSDFIKLLKVNDVRVYVKNKKKYRYWLDIKLIDVNLFGFIDNNELIEDVENHYEFYLKSISNVIKDFNIIVPYAIHQTKFDEEVELIKNINFSSETTYCFKFFNEVISDTLFEVEKNGIKVDAKKFKDHFNSKIIDDIAYTEYHIYNPTGRPSNCFDGINYSAIKKDDGSRSSFVSRYENGHLLMIDYIGFHPYIVANLIGYNVPANETIYEHLAKKYYKIDDISNDLITKSKKLTMYNLYGQIGDQHLNIEFFAKTELLKQKYWDSFVNKGYVTTPIYKRKITNKHVIDPNKNKLFAYIIQAAETEYGMDRLNACIKYTANKNIKPILYIYDAMLFDVGDVESTEIGDLVNIIRNNKFKVRVYKGNNYHDLVQI